jgi:regulator of replication initiation timing
MDWLDHENDVKQNKEHYKFVVLYQNGFVICKEMR